MSRKPASPQAASRETGEVYTTAGPELKKRKLLATSGKCSRQFSTSEDEICVSTIVANNLYRQASGQVLAGAATTAPGVCVGPLSFRT